MAKPTKRILDWASTGTTTDPGAGKEAAGWVTSDRPPAQWWNWILQSFGDWLTYFDSGEVDDDGDDLTLVHTATRDTNSYILNSYTSDTGWIFATNAEWQQGTGWGSVGAGGPSVISVLPSSTLPKVQLEYGAISGGSFTKSTLVAAPPVMARVALSAGSITVTGIGFTDSDVTLNTTDATIEFTDAFADINYNVMLTGEFESAHYLYDFDRVATDEITVYALNSNFAQQTMSSFVGTFHIIATHS